MLAQEGYQLRAVRATPHLPQRCQERQIGFARAVLLNALALPEPQRPLASALGHKAIDQRGFADASLPREEAQVALALEGFGAPLMQDGEFSLPRHQTRRWGRHGHGRRRWRQDTHGRGSDCRSRGPLLAWRVQRP